MSEGEANAGTDLTVSTSGNRDPVSAMAGSYPTTELTQTSVQQFGDDVLCGLYLQFGEEADRMRHRRGLLDWEIRRRLADRNATVIGDGKYALVLRPGAVRNEYLTEKLYDLEEHIGAEQWMAIMRPHTELSPDKRALNALSKRGGEIAAIIAEAVIETRGEGKLERKGQ